MSSCGGALADSGRANGIVSTRSFACGLPASRWASTPAARQLACAALTRFCWLQRRELKCMAVEWSEWDLACLLAKGQDVSSRASVKQPTALTRNS